MRLKISDVWYNLTSGLGYAIGYCRSAVWRLERRVWEIENTTVRSYPRLRSNVADLIVRINTLESVVSTLQKTGRSTE